jgi:hypothetical protein
MPKIARSPGYTAAVLLAGAAVLGAPAAARASAAQPGPAVVPCRSSALVTAISQAASARSATLVLARGCNYVLTSAATGDDGLPPVTTKILIIGTGGTRISRGPSAGPFRLFDVAAGGALTLVNLTVANGKITNPNEGAAGIRDAGTLVLRQVRLTGNTNGLGLGGGLSVGNGARATVSGSEFDGNSSAAVGGAVFNGGNLVIDRSTLTGNTAAFNGGAVFTNPATITRISRTVITRNRAQGFGGGILNQGAVALTGDRVTFNQAATAGGGIFNGGTGTLTLRFTVLASNTPDNCSQQGSTQGCQV